MLKLTTMACIMTTPQNPSLGYCIAINAVLSQTIYMSGSRSDYVAIRWLGNSK